VNGRAAEALGPFTDADFFELGTGSDALDIGAEEDVVYTWVMTHGSSNGVWFSNGVYGQGNGVYFQHWTAQGELHAWVATASKLYGTPWSLDTQALESRPVHVFSFAIAGTTAYWKKDLLPEVALAVGTHPPSTSYPAMLGRYGLTTCPFVGLIFEMRIAKETVTPSMLSALHAGIMS
jgi:hypothetical protein